MEVNCWFCGQIFCFTALHQWRRKMQFPNIKPMTYLPKWQFLNTVHFFTVSSFKLCSFAQGNAVSNVKPGVSQWKATLRNDIWFPTVNGRIYFRKLLMLCSQMSHYICKYHNDPKFSDRYAWANRVDPDQTAPTLFAILSASFGLFAL